MPPPTTTTRGGVGGTRMHASDNTAGPPHLSQSRCQDLGRVVRARCFVLLCVLCFYLFKVSREGRPHIHHSCDRSRGRRGVTWDHTGSLTHRCRRQTPQSHPAGVRNRGGQVSDDVRTHLATFQGPLCEGATAWVEGARSSRAQVGVQGWGIHSHGASRCNFDHGQVACAGVCIRMAT